uniref:TDP43_N domain-containing protein n=1 Tax=Panagrellus redivivus TaxID=6233 RepID=A0A7E4VBT3_PANRE
MAAQIQTVFRSHLRVCVEPVDIELDDDADGGLQFAALQSAFPGSSGIYYYNNDKTHTKTHVKFDGKKFHAPGNDWQEREYYVSLGAGRCGFPFGSYENASKQFERSVNLVSNLMGGKRVPLPVTNGNTAGSPVEKLDMLKSMVAGLGAVPSKKQESSTRSVTNEALQATAAGLEANYSNLAPLEQQFVDLARISNGKDSIIENQRSQIRQLTEEIQEMKRKSREIKEELERAEARFHAADEELTMLRNLGKEQAYMCERVTDLTRRLVEAKDETDRIINDFNAKLDAEITNFQNLLKDNAEKDLRIAEVEAALDRVSSENKDLRRDLSASDAKLIEQQLQYTNASEERSIVQDQLAGDNTHLLEKNEQLQSKCHALAAKCDEMEKLWNAKIQEAIRVEVNKNRALTEESKEQSKQISELTAMVDNMARENSELVRRFEGVKSDRDDLRRNLAMLESRVKDNFNKSGVGSPLRF